MTAAARWSHNTAPRGGEVGSPNTKEREGTKRLDWIGVSRHHAARKVGRLPGATRAYKAVAERADNRPCSRVPNAFYCACRTLAVSARSPRRVIHTQWELEAQSTKNGSGFFLQVWRQDEQPARAKVYMYMCAPSILHNIVRTLYVYTIQSLSGLVRSPCTTSAPRGYRRHAPHRSPNP